ncbi:hypothetical protein D3871_17575 [Noviherbaspirillum saxi]|uniref:MotA/TolQ/ExbB proton channel family protein n=1 Tax=Noviherbaspirillum saxi TaxID=2320863 RepID=A0A3A3FRA5_9BURK|nr:hypothetical protein D3871_17575 [Noviherbaspirillum saxi]
MTRPSVCARTAAGLEPPFILYLHWLSYAGLLLFSAYLLWLHDVWATLVKADPTGITLLILLIFGASTMWCGMRAHRLCRERADLADWKSSRALPGSSAPVDSPSDGSAVRDYLARVADASQDHAATRHLGDILAERLHGPSESAWWINGIQIKLGLLGKVIGFSILALQIARIENFDPAQSQTLLRNLTGGLGIALLTTAVGLVANILLGLQLVRLDRFADTLLADTLQTGKSLSDTGRIG